jgi:hypothetical protein
MQVESEFRIQEILRGWQRSFLTGRTGQTFLQRQEDGTTLEQGSAIQSEPVRTPLVQEIEDG